MIPVRLTQPLIRLNTESEKAVSILVIPLPAANHMPRADVGIVKRDAASINKAPERRKRSALAPPCRNIIAARRMATIHPTSAGAEGKIPPIHPHLQYHLFFGSSGHIYFSYCVQSCYPQNRGGLELFHGVEQDMADLRAYFP